MFKSGKYFLVVLALILSLTVNLGLKGLVYGAGKVVVYSAGPGGLANAIKAGFEAKTGVQEIVSKHDRENLRPFGSGKG